MEHAAIDGIDLAYELHGAGEPVVLVHWGVSAAWAAPLIAPLGAGHRLLAYDRAGFGASGRAPGPLSLADHAAHCHGLMRRLGIDRAHIVGHSSSAAIALQLAVDAPDAVQTLALLEPARPAPESETQAAFLREVVGPAVAAFRAGDAAGAVDAWFRGVFGPGYRAGLDRALPGSFEQAVADADAFFEQELPALQAWTFTEEERRPRHPTDARSSSASAAPQRSRSGGRCCSTGCPTPSRATCPARRTSCTSSSPARRPTRWRRSSRAIRSAPRESGQVLLEDGLEREPVVLLGDGLLQPQP